jgi:hypothetical protein
MICEGRAHLYLHTGATTCQWGTCAAEAILREAGGQMTDVYGAPLRYNAPELRNLRGVIAGNGAAHDRIVEITKSVASGFFEEVIIRAAAGGFVAVSRGSGERICPGPECVHVRTDFAEKGGLG